MTILLISKIKKVKKRLLLKYIEADEEIKKSITDKNIKYFPYSKFKHLELIGSGSHGSVVRANRKDKLVALKYFNNDKTTFQQVIKELELHEEHENILKLYGVTKIKTDLVFQMNKYCLVLEYADGGTLKDYLNAHFNELNWNDKIKLALQLAKAVSHLHKKDIIHRDLHDNNILVHRENIKLGDFGLSKKTTEISSNTSKIFGVVPYVDPKCFNNNQSQSYKLSKKSDVYSVGVLLWEISSGHRPFRDTEYDIKLSLEIINGKREEIIKGTPVEYSDLYTNCWKDEPNERLNIEEVVTILHRLNKSNFKNSREDSYKNNIPPTQSNEPFKYETERNKNSSKDLVNSDLHLVYKIDPKDLTNPARGKSDDKRGKDPNVVIRRIYKGQEVACKKTTEEMKNLEILMKISECKHILSFYGISTIENYNVMVFEWAERGTLRQLYEKKHIPWHCKVRIALNICRGLTFLQCANILHNNLKCENIMITETLEPKICNFELLYTSENEDMIPWLAPEKLKDSNSQYTTQCEVFSFGMLIWELTFEKIPYKGWKLEKIKDHVINGDRERIIFGTSIPKVCQEEYKKIINETWKQNPQDRISFTKLLDILEELYESTDDNSLCLLSDKTFDLDDDLELPDEDTSFVKVISLEEGIKAFKNKEHQKAWECFNVYSKDDNIIAKYWKGRYLWEGYLDGIKEREEGKKLLKEAADEGNSDAQLRYAFTLVKILDKDDNRKIFMDYLTKSANEGGNSTAQLNLGDIYLKGKYSFSKDKNEGIKWLKKAALQDNHKAIELLNELNEPL